MVRFESVDEPGDPPATLNDLARAAFTLEETDTVGVVLIAETAGLVGTAAQAIAASACPRGRDLFALRRNRDWLSLTSEPVHARGTALVVGVATRRRDPGRSSFVKTDLSQRPVRP